MGRAQIGLRSGILGGLPGSRGLQALDPGLTVGTIVEALGHSPSGCPYSRINRTMEYPEEMEDKGPLGMIYKKHAAKYLGISPKTLERYVTSGKLKPYKNQVNGRVYFDQADILKLLGSRLPQDRLVVLYCRAAPFQNKGNAGHGQNAVDKRLAKQVERCTGYCTAAGIRVDRIISEVGKGETLKGRRGWTEIMDLVMRKRVSMIVVETPDRICRWGMAECFADFLAWHGVELHVIQPVLQLQEYRDELTEDLTGIVYEARQLMGT